MSRERSEDLTRELYELARHYKVSYYSKLTKKELIFAILKANAEQEDLLFMEGVLEIIQSEGFGFLRPINYSPRDKEALTLESARALLPIQDRRR